MMRQFKMFLTCGLLAAGGAVSAQVEITETPFSPYGVTNEGVIVGTTTANAPFYLWFPETGEMREIGGVSAGNGIGGNANISDDGKWISAALYDSLLMPQAWDTIQFPGEEILFTDLIFLQGLDYGLAAGKIPGKDTVVMKSTVSGGLNWSSMEGNFAFSEHKGGFNVVAGLTYMGAAGGDNGALYMGSVSGSWRSIDSVPDMEVAAYRAVDFIEQMPSRDLLLGSWPTAVLSFGGL